jgi:uncharacterized spore protein YtfJ
MTTQIRTLDLESATDFDIAMAEARATRSEDPGDLDIDAAIAEARRAGAANRIEGFVERLAERVGGKASVRAVFGDPIERNGTTIVPVAKVRWGFGGGVGRGPIAMGPGRPGEGSPLSDSLDAGTDHGIGTGAGGGVTADPVGYLEIGPHGTRFRAIAPAMPSPIFLLAAGATAAIVLRAVAKLLRR